MKRVAVIGGGIVGMATALRVQERFPRAIVTVLEKEARVGAHQSTHNSGVLHCGLYYQPGSLKARLAVEGIREMVAFCRAHDIPHEICGKLVIATEPAEVPRLHELLRRGAANGLQGLELLGDAAAIRRVEPHAAGIAAVRVPEEGIVDYQQVCRTMAARIEAAGGQVRLGARVTGATRGGAGWVIRTGTDELHSDLLVSCAGLHADRVTRMAGATTPLRIVPFRGEYYHLADEARGLVRSLIYPVPDPRFPFLGVHFTRMISGGVEAGPNAVLALAREGYRWRDVDLRDLWDSLAFRGLWRFLRRYPSLVVGEVARSISRRRFCRALQRMVPEVRPRDLQRGGAGVRAQALSPTGHLAQDFELVVEDRAVHVLNAPSPAATASLAIGRHVAAHLPL